MESRSKFLFETSFAGPEADQPSADTTPRAQTFTEDELAAAQEIARAEGLAEGLEQARKEFDGTADAALGEIARHLTDTQHAADKLRSESLSLALTVARKLAPALMAREPMAEIEAFVGECLADVIDEPRVVVRVTEDLLANMVERIDELTAVNGFNGKIVVIAEESLTGSDCRIEWADGGADRFREQVDSDIDAAVARYLDPYAEARLEMENAPAATIGSEDEPGDMPEDTVSGLGVGEELEAASATVVAEAALEGGPIESTTPS